MNLGSAAVVLTFWEKIEGVLRDHAS